MSTAILYGTLVDDGGETCTCGFQWGLTVALGTTTGTQSLTTGGTITQTINGLAPLTIYYYRAFATNSSGTTYGATLAFATPSGGGGGSPIYGVNYTSVATLGATSIRESGAVLNGLLVNDNGSPCTVWFEYGLTSAYGTKSVDQYGKLTGETFYTSIGMGEGKAIHYRAVATNRHGTVYGSDMSFSSLSSLGPVGFASLEDLLLAEED